jgi:hypothetical protein
LTINQIGQEIFRGLRRISKKRPEPEAEAGHAHINEPQPSAPMHTLVQLQEAAGNQATQELLRSHFLRANLKVSQSEDAHEKEADQVAGELASSLPATSLELSDQAEAAGDSAPVDFAEGLGSGQPLDQTTRSLMESRFEEDFSHVRLHTDERAAASAREIDASAYTFGRDIVFEKGAYAPETDKGQYLLAHELTHVAQSAGSGKTPATVHRKTKGETMKEKADVWLSTDANLKTETDVLKAALSEIKRGKSVDYNKAAGIKRIKNAAKILAMGADDTTALIAAWGWLVDNRKSKDTKKFKIEEHSLFRKLQSPLSDLSDAFPKSQAKYWLKNTAPQIVDIIYQVADADLPADELYAYAMKEGLVDYVRGKIGLGQNDVPTDAQLKAVSTTEDISGFDYLGLDVFMTELTTKRDPLTGFLPKGFDVSKVPEEKRINEEGKEVRSGPFPNLTMAIQALAAMLKRRRKLFKEDAAASGYAAPTHDELVYWTYVYFNSGEFGGKTQLEKYKGKRKLSDWITLGEYPNAIKLLQSYQMIKKMNLF